jgi:hypothetical protein
VAPTNTADGHPFTLDALYTLLLARGAATASAILHHDNETPIGSTSTINIAAGECAEMRIC